MRWHESDFKAIAERYEAMRGPRKPRNKARKVWKQHMRVAIQRCSNPKATGYKYYGGKGIKFLLSEIEFEFLWIRDEAKKMKRPSIDRIDSNGHYCFENCRFIELSENCRRSAKRPRANIGF